MVLANMAHIGQSEIFKANMMIWKVFGMWPERKSSKIYKYYCGAFLILFCLLWWILFTLSVIFTPMNLVVILTQVTFYFSDFASKCKMLTIFLKQEQIMRTLEVLDSEEFLCDKKMPCEIIEKSKDFFRKYRIACSSFYFMGTAILLFVPIIEYWIKSEVVLEQPICEYYFLSDVIREKLFKICFIYQFFGCWILVISNAAADTFICGLIMMAITQFKVLNWKMSNLMLRPSEQANDQEDGEAILENRLTGCIKHHNAILKYCEGVQEIVSVPLFAQFGTGAITICVSMCSFLNVFAFPMARKDMIFMVCYTIAMTLEIFYPALLGSQLTKESKNLVFSAYCSDWIPRTESFKRSLRLLVERANRPVVLTGLKMFQVSLTTFASIIKTAYSFFTLVKCVLQE